METTWYILPDGTVTKSRQEYLDYDKSYYKENEGK